MKLPLSFRYYDPVLAIIKQMMPQEVLEINSLQKSMIEIFKGQFKKQLLKKIGVEDPDDKPDVLTNRPLPRVRFENPIKNNLNNYYISHTSSPHVMALQYSNYVCMDQHKADQTEECDNLLHDRKNNQPLTINYMQAAQVNMKQLKYIQKKRVFAAKIAHLKINGKKLDSLYKISNWLDDNLDVLYDRAMKGSK